MSTNTYFPQNVMHCITKTLKVYDMRYRLQAWCFFVYKSLEGDNKKEKDEIKNVK